MNADPMLWHRCATYYADFVPQDDDRLRPPSPTPRTPIPYAMTASDLQTRRRGR